MDPIDYSLTPLELPQPSSPPTSTALRVPLRLPFDSAIASTSNTLRQAQGDGSGHGSAQELSTRV
ncbi:MAG: hypothetical protein MUF75_05870 [Bacteroidia bacterium]|jgi:hypothetical protein|nr:hypothetical protein [Bacteroidia bacterium]